MNFSLSSKAIASSKADCLVVAVPEAGDWPESTRQADAALDGLITRLHKAGDITGKNASICPNSTGTSNRLSDTV